MKLKRLLIPVALLALNACRTTTYVEPGGHTYHTHDEPPAIYAFNMIDSYETNSEFEYTPLYVSPYINRGEFELFWNVDSDGPYRVELYINDTPDPDYGIRLSSEWCGPGEYCGNHSYQYCDYQSDLRMRCDLPESSVPYAERDIATLFYAVPERLYLVLEVCDESLVYCEYQSLAAKFE